MIKKLILTGLFIVILLIIIAVSTSKGPEMEVLEAKKGQISEMVEDTAYVQAVNDYKIEAPLNGRIIDLNIDYGDEVQEGQLLLSLENLELESEVESSKSQLAQAKADLRSGEITLNSLRVQLDEARKDLKRKTVLLEAQAIAQADYDTAVSNLASLENSVTAQEAYINNIRLRIQELEQLNQNLASRKEQLAVNSPMNGLVLDLPVKEGQVVAPGSLLIQLGSIAQLEVRAEILSDDLADVKTGQTVYITAAVLGEKRLKGKVTQIYPQAQEKTSALGVVQRRVPVIISLDKSANLRPGYEVRAAIETAAKDEVIIVPRESVRTAENANYQVIAVINGQVEYKEVKTGLKNQDRIEITEGLEAGDKIIRDAGSNIAEGKKVKAVVVNESI